MLFDPITLRSITAPQPRLGLADVPVLRRGRACRSDWHLVHLGARARRAAPGLVIVEATAVAPEGRISPDDLGIWNDEQVAGARAASRRSSASRARVAGIQLAHAGRKASTWSPLGAAAGRVGRGEGGWQTVGPSRARVRRGCARARASSTRAEHRRGRATTSSPRRARRSSAGFERRRDARRARLPAAPVPLAALQPARRRLRRLASRTGRACCSRSSTRVRAVAPRSMPLLVRVSATDWVEGGWTLDETVRARRLLA